MNLLNNKINDEFNALNATIKRELSQFSNFSINETKKIKIAIMNLTALIDKTMNDFAVSFEKDVAKIGEVTQDEWKKTNDLINRKIVELNDVLNGGFRELMGDISKTSPLIKDALNDMNVVVENKTRRLLKPVSDKMNDFEKDAKRKTSVVFNQINHTFTSVDGLIRINRVLFIVYYSILGILMFLLLKSGFTWMTKIVMFMLLLFFPFYAEFLEKWIVHYWRVMVV